MSNFTHMPMLRAVLVALLLSCAGPVRARNPDAFDAQRHLDIAHLCHQARKALFAAGSFAGAGRGTQDLQDEEQRDVEEAFRFFEAAVDLDDFVQGRKNSSRNLLPIKTHLQAFRRALSRRKSPFVDGFLERLGWNHGEVGGRSAVVLSRGGAAAGTATGGSRRLEEDVLVPPTFSSFPYLLAQMLVVKSPQRRAERDHELFAAVCPDVYHEAWSLVIDGLRFTADGPLSRLTSKSLKTVRFRNNFAGISADRKAYHLMQLTPRRSNWGELTRRTLVAGRDLRAVLMRGDFFHFAVEGSKRRQDLVMDKNLEQEQDWKGLCFVFVVRGSSWRSGLRRIRAHWGPFFEGSASKKYVAMGATDGSRWSVLGDSDRRFGKSARERGFEPIVLRAAAEESVSRARVADFLDCGFDENPRIQLAYDENFAAEIASAVRRTTAGSSSCDSVLLLNEFSFPTHQTPKIRHARANLLEGGVGDEKIHAISLHDKLLAGNIQKQQNWARAVLNSTASVLNSISGDEFLFRDFSFPGLDDEAVVAQRAFQVVRGSRKSDRVADFHLRAVRRRSGRRGDSLHQTMSLELMLFDVLNNLGAYLLPLSVLSAPGETVRRDDPDQGQGGRSTSRPLKVLHDRGWIAFESVRSDRQCHQFLPSADDQALPPQLFRIGRSRRPSSCSAVPAGQRMAAGASYDLVTSKTWETLTLDRAVRRAAGAGAPSDFSTTPSSTARSVVRRLGVAECSALRGNVSALSFPERAVVVRDCGVEDRFFVRDDSFGGVPVPDGTGSAAVSSDEDVPDDTLHDAYPVLGVASRVLETGGAFMMNEVASGVSFAAMTRQVGLLWAPAVLQEILEEGVGMVEPFVPRAAVVWLGERWQRVCRRNEEKSHAADGELTSFLVERFPGLQSFFGGPLAKREQVGVVAGLLTSSPVFTRAALEALSEAGAVDQHSSIHNPISSRASGAVLPPVPGEEEPAMEDRGGDEEHADLDNNDEPERPPIPPPKLVFTWVDFNDHCHELFSNAFQDLLDFLQLLSTQGENVFVTAPEMVSMELKGLKTESAIQQFLEGRERASAAGETVSSTGGFYSDEEKTSSGVSFFDFWVPNGVCGLRKSGAIRLEELFDVKTLDEYLRTRGMGGIVEEVDFKKQKFAERFRPVSSARRHAAPEKEEVLRGPALFVEEQVDGKISFVTTQTPEYFDLLLVGHPLEGAHADRMYGKPDGLVVPCDDRDEDLLPITRTLEEDRPADEEDLQLFPSIEDVMVTQESQLADHPEWKRGRDFFPADRFYLPPPAVQFGDVVGKAGDLLPSASKSKVRSATSDRGDEVPLLGRTTQFYHHEAATSSSNEPPRTSLPLIRRVPLFQFLDRPMEFARSRCVQHSRTRLDYQKLENALQQEVDRYYRDWEEARVNGEKIRDFVKIAFHYYILEDAEDARFAYGTYATGGAVAVAPSMYAGLRFSDTVADFSGRILQSVRQRGREKNRNALAKGNGSFGHRLLGALVRLGERRAAEAAPVGRDWMKKALSSSGGGADAVVSELSHFAEQVGFDVSDLFERIADEDADSFSAAMGTFVWQPREAVWTVHWRRGDARLYHQHMRRYQSDLVDSGEKLANVISMRIDFFLDQRRKLLREHLDVVFFGGGPAKNRSPLALFTAHLLARLSGHLGSGAEPAEDLLFPQPMVFIMTNEHRRPLLDDVREKFAKKNLGCFFLGDFVEPRDQQHALSANNKAEHEQFIVPSSYLMRDPLLPFTLEMGVACYADQFLGFGSDRIKGDISLPSLIINQLRLYTCGTASSQWMFLHPEGLHNLIV